MSNAGPGRPTSRARAPERVRRRALYEADAVGATAWRLRMLRWFLALSLVLFVVSAFTRPASAQSQTESRRGQPGFLINGRVFDTTGAPIAGARISATPQHGPTASAVSDEHGAFALSLAPGRYTI